VKLAETFESEHFLVTHYESDPTKVVVSFVSRGMHGAGEPIEEFRGTLAKLGYSAIFVIDRQRLWYNYSETESVFKRVAAMADRYPHVGAIGESMGGCGAILFASYSSKVSRILSFAPQFSVASPFISFDKRYYDISKKIRKHYFPDFAQLPDEASCVLLFGNTSWQEAIHQAMFRSAGFTTLIVDRAGHDVAGFLKKNCKSNILTPLLQQFGNFTLPFSGPSVAAFLSDVLSDSELLPEFSFRSEKTWEDKFLSFSTNNKFSFLPPSEFKKISLQKSATQSSVSQWSCEPTVTGDASRAISGIHTGTYSFHTAKEDGPWWSIDLGTICDIREIRLFNRMDHIELARRAGRFELKASDDGEAWKTVFQKDDDIVFGGVDGNPFVFSPNRPLVSRHIRLQLIGVQYLHLDQIEVYGIPGGS
jgi:hypothetical protein